MRQLDSRLQAAAVKLFASKGFAATSIRDIADEASLSVSALYYYVRSKEELLAEIMRVTQERMVAAARQVAEQASRPEDRLAGLVTLHIYVQARHPVEARVVDTEVRSLGPKTRKRIVALRDEYEELWRETLAQGLAEGVFHVPNPQTARLALLEMCNGVAFWYSPKGSQTVEQLAAQFVDFSLGMLRASRKRRSITSHDVSLPDPAWLASLTDGAGAEQSQDMRLPAVARGREIR